MFDIRLNWDESDKEAFTVVVCNNHTKIKQEIFFDRNRSINMIFADKDKKTLESFKNSLLGIPNSMYLSIINLDKIESIDSLETELEFSVRNNIITILIGTGDIVYCRELHILLKESQRCNIHALLGFDEDMLDEDGKLTDFNYQELNNPFVIQSVIYLDCHKDRNYNLDALYKGVSRRKAVL